MMVEFWQKKKINGIGKNAVNSPFLKNWKFAYDGGSTAYHHLQRGKMKRKCR